MLVSAVPMIGVDVALGAPASSSLTATANIYLFIIVHRVVKDKVGRPPGELGVSKSMECDIFPYSALTLLVG